MAKSRVINANAKSQSFEFVNFRGAHFKNVNFENAVFYGCDFWGTKFHKCKFHNVKFQDCVFMACILKKCNFKGAKFSYITIVNTNLSDCANLDISSGVTQYNVYPKYNVTAELKTVLDILKDDYNLKKNKLLFITNKKYNDLNLFLLEQRYDRNALPNMLIKLNNRSTAKITAYKKMEKVLTKLSNNDTI